MNKERKKLPGKLIKIMRRTFPGFAKWLQEIKDVRDPTKIIYQKESLMWEGLLLYLFKMESRRSINYRFNTDEFIKNFEILTGQRIERMPHHDTLNYFFKRVKWEELEELKRKMINALIRDRRLEKWRLLDKYYLLAFDGTQTVSFEEKHCEKCLTRKSSSSGKTQYYHYVLEVKLVTSFGLSLSIATDFLEDRRSDDKQDCELRAFYRITSKIKKMFPQMQICVSGDSLFAVKPVFDICMKNNWRFIFTFKEGRSSEVFSEAMILMDMEKQNRLTRRINEKIEQNYAWVQGVNYHGLNLNVIQCFEKDSSKSKATKFVYITDLKINEKNCYLISDGGRDRWKIENQGFNTQKNEGYNLEHVFSTHQEAYKNFYILIQIAHIFNQLFEYSSSLKDVKKTFGSIVNLTREVFEVFRNFIIDKEQLIAELSCPYQFRFNST